MPSSPAARSTKKLTKALLKGKKVKSKHRIEVRNSPIHGRGVFALTPFVTGEKIIRYKGEVIDWEEALRRHPHDPLQPNHTFYFTLNDTHVIDGGVKGNRARWINHSCDPNCETDIKNGKVYVRAVREIAAGEELNYDYGLVIDEPITDELKKDYACRCGSKNCRRTMLMLDPS